MWDRVLLALDQYESGQSALRMTMKLAAVTHSEVRVLHVRALSKWARVPPLETPAEAEYLVSEAVFSCGSPEWVPKATLAPCSKTA
jgi:hypothetical protein